MHRNYFLFYRQALDLNQKLQGKTVYDCFTHRKNELVLHLDDYFLRIGLSAHIPYLILYAPQGIRTPSTRFFQPLIGQKVEKVTMVPFDKALFIQMKQNTLRCYFFGKTPNIYMVDAQANVMDQFKKEGTMPFLEDNKHFLDILNCREEPFYLLFKTQKQNKLHQLLRENLGGFNNLLVNEVLHRAALSGEQSAAGLSSVQRESLFLVLKAMAGEIQRGPALIYYQEKRPAHLSTVECSQLSGDFRKESYTDLNQAWKIFARDVVIEQQRLALQRQIDRTLSGRISYLEHTLKKMLDEEELLQKKEEAELKGNLLLTFMGEIEPGIKAVTVTNIFSDKKEAITIKLNPAKSVQQNAQNYFEKFKHLDIKRDQLKLKKNTFSKELAYWEKIYHTFQAQQSLPELSKLYKSLMARGIIQAERSQQKAVRDLIHAFLHYNLDGKYDIYVGKNAKNNELLTFKFARKQDLWFHAQGVAGSHVIIRREKNDPLPPQVIIAHTAAIAAFYSEAKHAAKVPVVYTEARYVRKPHKAAPGLVTLSHEKSIMVSPQKPF
jgi:predicted ribosome quality control (RQC) complex YloA/Tae2 family protein